MPETDNNIQVEYQTSCVDVSRDVSQLPRQKINNFSQNWGIMLALQENLNVQIGVQMYKKYLNAAFWNYISTPINFTITLFTALSAGQTGSNSNLITQNQLFYILFTSFFLSIINTFFKLKEKAISNYEAVKQYEHFGYTFENIYYTAITNDHDVELKIKLYKKLTCEIEEYTRKDTIDSVNYLTECIFRVIKKTYYKDGFHGGKFYGERRLNRNERLWYLDGKPNNVSYYKNSFPIDIENTFVNNFDKKYNFVIDASQDKNENSVVFSDGEKNASYDNEAYEEMIRNMSAAVKTPKI